MHPYIKAYLARRALLRCRPLRRTVPHYPTWKRLHDAAEAWYAEIKQELDYA